MGNPGTAYQDTRHNAGFLLADALQARWSFPRFKRAWRARSRRTEGKWGEQPVVLVKPQTYMNRSGAALARLDLAKDFDPARDLLILVDEAALPLGGVRIRAHGSAGGHNGLRSIAAVLQSNEYPRLRVGVGPVPDGVEDLADYVLAPFTAAERDTFDAALPTMMGAVECWIADGIDAAMNQYNRLGKPE